MTNAYVLTGTLTDPRTLRLSEPLPVGEGEVRVVVEVVRPTGPNKMLEVLHQIWAEQKARGHVPPTAEEVEAYIRAERDSWGD